MKPCFLRKYPLSLMGEANWWKYYTDHRDSLTLDIFRARFAETQVKSEEKFATGVIHPRTFVVFQESPLAWK